MKAPAYTLAQIAKLEPTCGGFEQAKKLLPARKKITALMAADAGVPLRDLIWTVTALAAKDADIERRSRLFMADCGARALLFYENTESSDAPRKSILATRQFARGEIDKAAWDAKVTKAAKVAYAAWAAGNAVAAGVARATVAAVAVDAFVVARNASGSRAALTAWTALPRDAAGAANAAKAAEEEWQLERLVAWFSADEPEDWPLPEIKESEAA